MARKVRIDMTGLRFGRLVGVAFSHTSPGGRAAWLFACDCGGEVVADGGNVRRGGTASCGCLHREISAARLTVHGRRAARRYDPTWRAWQEINSLCRDPAAPRWRDHGARGIRVHADWAGDFRRFLADMGERPADSVLARLDADGDFAPGNCRWKPIAPRAVRARTATRTARLRPPAVANPEPIPAPAR